MARWRALLAAACFCMTAAAQEAPVAPPEHRRGVEQTFLTYPEWFLVFSPAEYAQFVRRAQPDAFPFWGHIGQFWESYGAVFRESRARGDELNPGYHLMIMVIGTSTTVEYALRSAYESLIGRLAAATAGQPTPEDRFAAGVAQDYVDFIRVLPWYEYDFGKQLKTLWTQVPATGPDLARKWERRFALTTEYGIKALYAQMIKAGTKSIYDTPLLVTSVVVQPAPKADARLPEVKVLQALPDGAVLATIPRYDAFTAYAQGLAAQGLEFREVAGNRSIMLVSLLGDQAWEPHTGIAKRILEQPILTQPGRKRVVATVQVQQLGEALREWQRAGVQVEHLFDY
ncbi:hypothetical protein HHL11_03670 [Ramlibacter sp. G-1-2-2]|uniref:DUF4932 domain-containing protein n=1 Tax=Ramlibacter agri TaxID=2728837 RepID=A0A848GXF8_9BURK|nr:hypothetical protein [Ramlibacter agri]NML42837.1 hypothetical protein [Ramlibacter agri]